jgi:AdoMet-dependent heme synthase
MTEIGVRIERPQGALPVRVETSRYPAQPLHHLDALWIQVAGTLCNLRCTHCFVSAGPGDERHALLSREQVRAHVADGLALGVREFYLTGGEPFLHPEMLEILDDTLVHGPCTVLTNGTLFNAHRLETLARLADRSRFSLEIRVSLDGSNAEDHDRLRGSGSFERAIAGLRALERHDLLPIVTVTENDEDDSGAMRERYRRMLRVAGLARPRLKTLPMFRIGREVERTRPYAAAETLRDLPPEAFDAHRLQCSAGRAVTSRGVFVCPLLVDEPRGRMGARLAEAMGPHRLTHGACTTCYATGMSCGNG